MVAKLFTNIFLTKGYSRSLIVDPSRGSYHLIPNDWYNEIIKLQKNFCDYKKIKEEMNDELFNFLLEEEMLIILNDTSIGSLAFPDIEIGFERPFDIQCAFVSLSQANISLLIESIDKGVLDYIFVFRLFIQKNIKNTDVNTLINSLFLRNNAIEIILYTNNENINYNQFNGNVIIKKVEFDLDNKNFFQSHEYMKDFPIFSVHMFNVLESFKYNIYNNRTIFIDTLGNIGCGSDYMPYKLKDLINGSLELSDMVNEFQHSWETPLKKVEICKVCEFNNICIDCNIPYQFKNSLVKKDCGYNPFLNKWYDEEYFISSSKCGFYNEYGEFVVDSNCLL